MGSPSISIGVNPCCGRPAPARCFLDLLPATWSTYLLQCLSWIWSAQVTRLTKGCQWAMWSLGHKRFVPAPPFYRAGGHSWRPPAQNHQGPLGKRPPIQKESVLAGTFVARQLKASTKMARTAFSPDSLLFGLCPRGARVQLQNHQIQGGRFCSWISWRRWL